MQKIKHIFREKVLSEEGKNILTVIIIILSSAMSFWLGRLSVSSIIKDERGEARVVYQDSSTWRPGGQVASQEAVLVPIKVSPQTIQGILEKKESRATASSTSEGALFFASKRGKKYYPINCRAGESIKIENRVYFKTSGEAESAGFTKSTSC